MGFWKNFLVLNVSFKWRFPGVSSLCYILAITNANKRLALKHQLGDANLGLGVRSSFAFAFASVTSFCPCHGRWSNTMAKQAKMSIVGLSIAIW
jgi:hypothetical protein